MSLDKEIQALLNRNCIENGSNTPDYILASYLIDCLNAFNNAVNQRESWYGRKTSEDVVAQNSTSNNTGMLKCLCGWKVVDGKGEMWFPSAECPIPDHSEVA